MNKSSTRILIANRGEIACRIIRTARALGKQTVAVYSEADREAPHVKLADRALCIGPAPVAESYLDIEAIVRAAQQSEADAVHPGYGFLAENAGFARAVENAGLIFIGPTPEAIELMGNKAAAKVRMIEAGVPCVPGYEGADQSEDAFLGAAKSIGFPIMVKAAAGGGGRGMRVVESESELKSAIQLARAEAQSAFGSGQLILERAVQRPRHVEIQVFADHHGHVIHLGERDCSVQRRHQKIVEEAPSPAVTEALRSAMGAAAVEAAQTIGYRGAGTVEFLLDASGEFYFLEMNTRLQVEHPVTELITGLDLVALQIKVAEGHPLGIAQDDVALTGHAIEVRLYAEDPAQQFMPSTGEVGWWQPPRGEGIRVDAGIETGYEVSPFYDPMVAKIIAGGSTRDESRRRLIAALESTAFFGVKSNRDFLVDVLRHNAFAGGEATTAFIAEAFPNGPQAPEETRRDAAIAAVLQYEAEIDRAQRTALGIAAPLVGWASAGALVTHYNYSVSGSPLVVEVSSRRANGYRVRIEEDELQIEVVDRRDGEARLTVDGLAVDVMFWVPGSAQIELSVAGRTLSFTDTKSAKAAEAEVSGGGRVVAPMHGLLVDVSVVVGDEVKKGQRLVVLEAMKMQHEIVAEIDGVVEALHFEQGQQAAADALIAEIKASDA